MTTASTEAQTDAAPLIPHSHGASDGFSRIARAMPTGNAIPMKKPSGTRIATETAMRIGVYPPAKCRIAAGVRAPNTTSTASRSTMRSRAARGRFAASAVEKLPAPLASSRENSTTDRL